MPGLVELKLSYNHLNGNLPSGITDLTNLEILLLDNNLPDGMGWTVADNIREKFPKMHITLISAYHTAKEFKAKLDNSINILEKPISLRDIERYL